jgi:hypothetical protein
VFDAKELSSMLADPAFLQSKAGKRLEKKGVKLQYLQEQFKLMQAKNGGQRYDAKFLRVCMLVWATSPKAYNEWRDNSSMVLPHGSTLRR